MGNGKDKKDAPPIAPDAEPVVVREDPPIVADSVPATEPDIAPGTDAEGADLSQTSLPTPEPAPIKEKPPIATSQPSRPKCGNCGSEAIGVAGGQRRCNQCGHSWI